MKTKIPNRRLLYLCTLILYQGTENKFKCGHVNTLDLQKYFLNNKFLNIR